MQIIILTSEKFEGRVVVKYQDPGMGVDAWGGLVSVDFSEANLLDKTKQYILQVLRDQPRLTPDWTTGHISLMATTTSGAVDFEEDFWKPYNRKINKDRVRVIWKKMNEVDRMAAAVGVLKYNRYIAKCTKRPKKDPEGYLKDRMWLTDWDNMEPF